MKSIHNSSDAIKRDDFDPAEKQSPLAEPWVKWNQVVSTIKQMNSLLGRLEEIEAAEKSRELKQSRELEEFEFKMLNRLKEKLERLKKLKKSEEPKEPKERKKIKEKIKQLKSLIESREDSIFQSREKTLQYNNFSKASQKNVDETLPPESEEYNKQAQRIEKPYDLLGKLPEGTLQSVVRGSSLFELESESSRDGASKRAREESLSDLAQAEPPKKRRKTELDKLMINGERTLIFNETELPRRSERLKKGALNDSGQDISLKKNRKRG